MSGLIKVHGIIGVDNACYSSLFSFCSTEVLMEVKENKFSTDIRKHFFILQVINVWNESIKTLIDALSSHQSEVRPQLCFKAFKALGIF